MMHRLTNYLVVVLLVCWPCSVFAEESVKRDYELAGYGTLELLVPKSWRDEVSQPPDELPPTIVFTPGTGASFQIF